jgi:hypothetical protein
MKRFFLRGVIPISLTSFCYSQNFPYKIGAADNDAIIINGHSVCDMQIKVQDNRPPNCDFNDNYYFYPVLVEDFNEDARVLMNNWDFKDPSIDDDDYTSGNGGNTWMVDPYNNGNVFTSGGWLKMQWKKEVKSTPNKTYDFTGGMFWSIFKLRQGVFEAKIRLPDNPNFFPAYWLERDQEIDVFEFYDGNLNNNAQCDTYHHMKMTIHGYKNTNGGINEQREGTHCQRNRKFSVPSDFFQTPHIYKCVWTDYKIEIYLDGTLVGYSRKYYDGPFSSAGCHDAVIGGGVPLYTRDCNYMSTAAGCQTYLGWPFNQCIVYNKVYNDLTFPMTSKPMNIIMSMALTNAHASTLLNSWNNFASDDKAYSVDWVKIYQPVNCGVDHNICSLNDFFNATGNTHFLSGNNIRISPNQNCSFSNPTPAPPIWTQNPLHILAANQIEINGDAFFEEGNYLRAEIVDCSGGFQQFQRGEQLFLSDEEINALENQQNDSLLATNPALRDSLASIYQSESINGLQKPGSVTDNGAVSVFPNPTDAKLLIDINEEEYNDLNYIELVNNLGQVSRFEKSRQLNLEEYPSGMYHLKFIFSFGYVVVKSLTIRR